MERMSTTTSGLVIIWMSIALVYSDSSPTIIPANFLGSAKNICLSGVNAADKMLIASVAFAKASGYAWVVQDCGPGRWFEVVNFDLMNSSHTCPFPWTERSVRGQKHCISPSCQDSLNFKLPFYSRVCGRATGQAYGSVDAFRTKGDGTINGIFMDGLTITHGYPRKHIWSFGAGHGATFRCPCDSQDRSFARLPPSFVGDNYFCDGSYNGDLWDGLSCATACCYFHSPPWFRVHLPAPSSDTIEVRLCTDQDVENESVGVRKLQLFVQ